MKMKFSVAKENTLGGIIFRKFINFLVAPVFCMIWLKKIEGKENIPTKGAYILACNHQSYLDFLLLVSALPNIFIRFLAAEKFYDKAFTKFIMEYSGQIKIDRESKKSRKKALETGLRLLENGCVLAIFPQGTRSRNGEIEKTFTGVSKFAINAEVPVIPIGIRGAFHCWAPGGKPKYQKKVSIHIGNPISLDRYYKKSLNENDFREITNNIMTEIARLARKKYIKEEHALSK